MKEMKPLEISKIQEKTLNYWRQNLEEEVEYINAEIDKAAGSGSFCCTVLLPSHSHYLNLIEMYKEAGYNVDYSIISNPGMLQVFEPIKKPLDERMLYSKEEVIEVGIEWEKSI